MQQTLALVEALKRALKARGITYAQVAKALKLSEPSVKRMFSGGHFTLDRLDQVCELAHTTIADLARALDGAKDEISQLTLEQERAIMADRKLLLVALCALNHLSVEQMVQTYTLTRAECIALLLKLDRIHFLELLPGDRIKLRVTRAFAWLPDGPIQQYFKERAQSEYFASRFDGPGEMMLVVNGMLTAVSAETAAAKLRRIANEFTETHHTEAYLPPGQRRPVSMVLAIRPWELTAFRDLRRRAPGVRSPQAPRAVRRVGT
jgi:transcriptional regulator with XRE-family HTH domain